MRFNVRYLDVARLQRALAAGLKKLIAEREYLNRINVFPVADGDTGNNLAQTARAALKPLVGSAHASVRRLLDAVAEAALDGAQGNSGTILAQYFQGLADALEDNPRVSTREFVKALSAAAKGTRAALENPREGTIISVIDSVAKAAQQSTTKDFAELLPLLRDRAKAALQETTGQLEELRRAGVVDAGASGFVSILDGCVDFLFSGTIEKIDAEPDELPSHPAHDHHGLEQDLSYRYCTECLLANSELDIPELREILQPHGNSLVIAGSKRRLRVHIHSNDPEEIFELAGQHGEILQKKADDMIGQARTLHRKDRNVVIVTDSAADIPESLLTEYDIHMIPLRVQFGEESYLDKMGMSPADFRDELKNNPNKPGTSQPTPGDYRRMFEFLLTHFGQVTAISLGKQLSGTFQGAINAANNVSGQATLDVVDSANVSVGQGLLAVRAAELAEAGHTGKDLVSRIENERTTIRTFALVTDLSNAVRSGRIRPALKVLANWLHITPVLTNTKAGKIGVCGYLPGRFNLAKRFARLVAGQLDQSANWQLAVARDNEQANVVEQLVAELTHINPNVDVAWETDIGPAFGVHAGMNAVVVAVRQH